MMIQTQTFDSKKVFILKAKSWIFGIFPFQKMFKSRHLKSECRHNIVLVYRTISLPPGSLKALSLLSSYKVAFSFFLIFFLQAVLPDQITYYASFWKKTFSENQVICLAIRFLGWKPNSFYLLIKSRIIKVRNFPKCVFRN